MTIIDFNKATRQGEAIKGSVDADDIRRRLHDRTREFVSWLFSGRAFITKQEARIGNVYGEAGASLSIQLSGPDAGLWHDHATGEGGDLIGLYRANMGYSSNTNFQLSLKELAKEFLGDPVEVERVQWQPSVTERIDKKRQELGSKPRDDMQELGAPVATYRYYDTRGNVIASVVRYEPNGQRKDKTFRPYCHKIIDGKPKWVTGAPDLRPLYRIPEIVLASTIVLCEGEGKADALARIGIEATSAMQGAQAPIDKTDWSPLYGKTVIIWPDNDEPGQQYAKTVATRLQALGSTVKMIAVPAGKPEKWDAVDCIAEGEDPGTLIAAATSVSHGTGSRLKLYSLADLESLPPITWLVDKTLTRGGLSMIWGRSGSLKSFVALDMAMCIATGLDWHGNAVQAGRVLYIAAEGAFGLAQRAFGWAQRRGEGKPAPDLLLLPQALVLTGNELFELLTVIKASGPAPTFIVVDTLSRTIGGGNPNQPSDMNLYVDAVDRLRTETGAHVMVVHHAGEDETRNEIGNKGLRNACDTVIYVKRNSTSIQLINEAPKGKQKDAEEFKTISLRPVKVAYQVRGDERTTLVLNLDDDAPPASEEVAEPARQRLGANEKSILKALRKAKTSLGETRLLMMAGIENRGTFSNSIRSLIAKELIRVVRSEDDTRNEWELA